MILIFIYLYCRNGRREIHMKKSFLTLAALLLFAFCAAPTASADENTYLGGFMVGDAVNCLISDGIEPYADIQADYLPEGCELVTEEDGNVWRLYLRGHAVNAGQETFTLTINASQPYNIICSMQVYAQTPSVSAGPSVECMFGDLTEIAVSAQVTDGGTLSYQWFFEDGTQISGATGSVYQPSTFLVGTTGYYCTVTNTNGGGQASVRSQTIYVTVQGAVPQAISVATLPGKTEYSLGELLDTTGLKILVDYGSGYTETITNGFGVYPTAMNVAGVQRIEVNYEGLSCSFEVRVKDNAAEVDGIGVLYLPDKTLYKLGDTLDTDGLVVRAYTPNGQFDVYEGLECSPMQLNTAGSQTITVKYAGKTCTFKVTVEEENTIQSVSVAALPTKTEYTVGDSLDTTGLTIRVLKKHGSEDVTTGFTCNPKVLATAGTQTVTVIYEGKYTCSFTVNVKQKDLKPSPSPSPSATPSASPSPSASVSPSPTSNVIQHETHKTSFGATLAKVILVIAIFALVGLGAYVYVMRKKGKR